MSFVKVLTCLHFGGGPETTAVHEPAISRVDPANKNRETLELRLPVYSE
ncbi:hypothetical protein [Bacillus sp. FJAT-42376]|nr:hypothetical protein [Bacillus sp. FJAT-42376]